MSFRTLALISVAAVCALSAFGEQVTHTLPLHPVTFGTHVPLCSHAAFPSRLTRRL